MNSLYQNCVCPLVKRNSSQSAGGAVVEDSITWGGPSPRRAGNQRKHSLIEDFQGRIAAVLVAAMMCCLQSCEYESIDLRNVPGSCSQGLPCKTGYQCVDGVCEPKNEWCGDGIVQGPLEECDDGDSNSDDAANACRLDCTSHRCGDGVVDDGENCDEGTEINGTYGYCNVDCLAVLNCGDGIVQVDDEQCDSNGLATASCDSDCTLVECGDGLLNTEANEECDDGIDNSDEAPNACRRNCRRALCGDGVVDNGETCDEGSGVNGTYGHCNATCSAMLTCGDGIVQAGREACDEGNANSDERADACRLDCTLPSCGDGVVDKGEHCDEGSGANGTYGHCNATCTGMLTCGDGIVQVGHEACDEGTGDNGKYRHCNAVCTGILSCGDGIVQAGHEACDEGAGDNGTYGHCNLNRIA